MGWPEMEKGGHLQDGCPSDVISKTASFMILAIKRSGLLFIPPRFQLTSVTLG
jgi:hypothetical protein